MADCPIFLNSVFDYVSSDSKGELLATFVLKTHTTITTPNNLPPNLKKSIHNAPMPSLDTLPDELILEIASYFLDDYIFDKVYLGPDFIFHIKEISRPGEPETLFHLIRPYTAMAMVCRRLWNVLPKQLKRPIPLEIVEFVEMCQQESNWARPFAKKRGWDYVALDNRREDWWKDHFWDLRAERAYGRKVCYEPETEAWTFVKVFKEKGCAEPMDSDNDKLGNPT